MHHTRIEKLLKRHVEVCEGFYVTERFRRWLDGEVRLLRCHGAPRSGKTSFAAALANRLRKDNWSVESIYLGHGSSRTDHVNRIRQVVEPTILIIDGLDYQEEDSRVVEKLLTNIPVRTILVQSRTEVEKRTRCSRCYRKEMLLYRDCKQCGVRYCHLCEKCAHNVELRAAHIELAGLNAYVEERVTDRDVRRQIIHRAENSFVEARLLVEAWLRCQNRAMFDTQDHILKCQIEFYDSLLHHVSYVGSVILALVAAEVPFRFNELADVVDILTSERITMTSLLRETCHLVDIEYLEVPIVKVRHRNVMAFIREEAELPKIDMAELCRQGIEQTGPFSKYALRNWSKFDTVDNLQRKYDNYLSRFDEFRERTFLALNDDSDVKFYGKHVDHLKAWHGLPVVSKNPDQRGSLPIHIAASRGHAHLIKGLAESEDQCNGRGQTAFQVAMENGKLNVCEKLPTDLSTAIEYNRDYAMARITAETDDLAALHTALRLGAQEIVEKFPQSLRDRQASILMLRKMPELLTNTEINDDWLQYANEESKELLHEKGLTYCPGDLSSPLHSATFQESHGLLEYANELDANGRTPLWNAVTMRDEQRINLLLDHTDVDKVDQNGMTVLEYAWDLDEEDIALKLVAKARRLKSRRLADMLAYAIKQNRQKSVKTLVMKGADLWGFADLGSSPSETAQSRGANINTIELVQRMEEIFIKGKDLLEIDYLEIYEDGAETPRR